VRSAHSLPLLLVSCSWLAAVACSSSSSSGTTADDGGAADVVSEPAAPYTQTLLANAPIGSNSSLPDFQKATASVELTGGPFANVNLVVDLVSPCFPWSNWTSNPPPSGQDWPADCDAFDRNFEMSLIEPVETDAGDAGNTTPGLELIRAITPFGGPEHLEQDVTDAFNGIQGPRTFQIIIPTYSDSAGKVSGSNGGWTVSAHLDVTPGTPPANVLAVIPLYYDSVTAGETVADIPFTMPVGTTTSRLEYRVTGHGGASDPSSSCFGPAEEFCRRLHHVYLDDAQIEQVTPWRNDCTALCTVTSGGPFGSYCAENPCGDQASVEASRANWCPGSETPPYAWTPGALSTPGSHALRFAIDDIYTGGEWRVSATVYAYGD
jgi:Peptide-N-glycosidase F, C terminal